MLFVSFVILLPMRLVDTADGKVHTATGPRIGGGEKDNMKDLTNFRFGRLQVLGLYEVKNYSSSRNNQTKAYYSVVCECGNVKVVRGEHLTQGLTVSCGCLAKEVNARRLRTHGKTHTPEHRSWVCMKARIFSPDEHHKKYYSDVHIDERWLGPDGFVNFVRDMGNKPDPSYEIDRINPYGDYEPSNCRWATRAQQMNNLRKSSK